MRSNNCRIQLCPWWDSAQAPFQCVLCSFSPQWLMFSPNAGVSRQQKANEINPLEVNVDGWVLLCFCPMVLVKSPASTFILIELYLSTISIFLKDYSWIVTKVRVLASHVDLAFQCIHSSHMIFAAPEDKILYFTKFSSKHS